MFKFRFFSLVVISMMLILGLSAVPVFADSGGIKVDDDNNCFEPNKQANFLCAGGACATLWLNAPQGLPPNLLFEVYPPGNSQVASCLSGVPAFTQCGNDPSYYWYQFTTCGGGGVFNGVLYSGPDVVSTDSWRQ